MPRNMSFALTTEQIRNRTKTVTRRLGWANLKPGDRFWAVKKAQGLKRGERVRGVDPILIRCGAWEIEERQFWQEVARRLRGIILTPVE